MRKKQLFMLSGIVAVAITTVVWKKNLVLNANNTSSLLVQNVEALTSEGEAERVISYCVYNIKGEPKYGDKHEVIYCGDCQPHSATTEWGEGQCSRNK